jgi:hypothetical protein
MSFVISIELPVAIAGVAIFVISSVTETSISGELKNVNGTKVLYLIGLFGISEFVGRVLKTHSQASRISYDCRLCSRPNNAVYRMSMGGLAFILS